MNCQQGTASRPDPTDPGLYQYIRVDCGKLSCPKCGRKKARAYLKAIAAAAEKARLCRHIILTLDPSKYPAGTDTVAYVRDTWNKFRTYLYRKFKDKPPFICVLELQGNGNAHLHVLFHHTLSQEWIIESWTAVGGGYEDKIRYRDVHRIAAYLAPYVTKELLERIPKGRRKVTTSRGIRLFEKKAPSGWQFTRDWMSDIERLYSADVIEIDRDEGGYTWLVIQTTISDASELGLT